MSEVESLRQEIELLKSALEKERERNKTLIQESDLLKEEWKQERERANKEAERADKLEEELLEELEKAQEHQELLKTSKVICRLLEDQIKINRREHESGEEAPKNDHTGKQEAATKEKEEQAAKKREEEQRAAEKKKREEKEQAEKKKREEEEKKKKVEEEKQRKEEEEKKKQADRKLREEKEQEEKRKKKEEEEARQKEKEVEEDKPRQATAGESVSTEKEETAPVSDEADDYAAKLMSKNNANALQNAQDEAREWIEKLSGDTVPANAFSETLKSGVVLCKMLNAIKPNTVSKINTMKMPFMQMENINLFLKGCESLGVPTYDLFQINDLFQEKNVKQVVHCLHALGRVVRLKPPTGFDGPHLGKGK